MCIKYFFKIVYNTEIKIICPNLFIKETKLTILSKKDYNGLII